MSTCCRLGQILEKEDRANTKLLIYCTGGIRCVKVGAYLKQKMGFPDVQRLKGGIVAYVRDVKEGGGEGARDAHGPPDVDGSRDIEGSRGAEESHDAEEGAHGHENVSRASAEGSRGPLSGPFAEGSLFKGINYVFDGRVGSVITADIPEVCSCACIPVCTCFGVCLCVRARVRACEFTCQWTWARAHSEIFVRGEYIFGWICACGGACMRMRLRVCLRFYILDIRTSCKIMFMGLKLL